MAWDYQHNSSSSALLIIALSFKRRTPKGNGSFLVDELGTGFPSRPRISAHSWANLTKNTILYKVTAKAHSSAFSDPPVFSSASIGPLSASGFVVEAHLRNIVSLSWSTLVLQRRNKLPRFDRTVLGNQELLEVPLDTLQAHESWLLFLCVISSAGSHWQRWSNVCYVLIHSYNGSALSPFTSVFPRMGNVTP